MMITEMVAQRRSVRAATSALRDGRPARVIAAPRAAGTRRDRRRTTSRRRRPSRCRRARARRLARRHDPVHAVWSAVVSVCSGSSELIMCASVQRCGAQLVGLARADRRAAIAPGGADVGDDGGNLVVGEGPAKGGMP